MEAHEMTDEFVLTLKAKRLTWAIAHAVMGLLTVCSTGALTTLTPIRVSWRKASGDARQWELAATFEFGAHVPDDERRMWAVINDCTRRVLAEGKYPGTEDDAWVTLLPREEAERRLYETDAVP